MGYSSSEINQQMMAKINALDLPRAMVPILLRCDEEGPEELTTEEIADNWLRKIKEVNKVWFVRLRNVAILRVGHMRSWAMTHGKITSKSQQLDFDGRDQNGVVFALWH